MTRTIVERMKIDMKGKIKEYFLGVLSRFLYIIIVMQPMLPTTNTNQVCLLCGNNKVYYPVPRSIKTLNSFRLFVLYNGCIKGVTNI